VSARLKVGLIGVGRLGRVYARDLATRIPETRLVHLADVNAEAAQAAAKDFDVPRWSQEPLAVIEDKDVDAVVIVSPTDTHRPLVLAAMERSKATFCEKPPALSVEETLEMKRAIEKSGVFFQMGFMRRFDPGYAAAKQKLDAGEIGTPLVFKATSRDPFRPSLEYADPASSGGMLIDMGIHDFDLARFFMGEVESVHTYAGTLAYPELKSVGDLDNAVVGLRFASGSLGMVDLSRNGIYGYDIQSELLGTEGTLRIGYLRETPLFVMKKNNVSHDTVPYFMERFAQAYTAQLQDFAQNVLQQRKAKVTIDDGLKAIQIAVAALRSHETGQPVQVA
jgi:inositol 2-dehydrogenase